MEDYLVELVDNLESVKEEDRSIPFIINQVKEKGFVVKIGGVFAFLSYKYMPWRYPLLTDWHAVADTLVDKKFFGKVFQVYREPLFVLVNGEAHNFKPVQLNEGESYEGVVLRHENYGVYVELGYHFDWEYGSLVGLVHENNVENLDDYASIAPGGIVNVPFLGYNAQGQLVLGEHFDESKGLPVDNIDELEDMLGSEQVLDVSVDEEGRQHFFVNGQIRAMVPVNKAFYPGYHVKVRRLLTKLEDGDRLKCEVIDVVENKGHLIVKVNLVLETAP